MTATDCVSSPSSAGDREQALRVGIVGTGFIAEAMVEAFVSGDGVSVTLSPRGARIAGRLAAEHPDHVVVAASNQAVVDASQVVILSVRPAEAEEVLGSLVFREGHRVVNVVAGLGLPALRQAVGPKVEVMTAIPLPAMRSGDGVTVVMPPDPTIAALFARGGAVVETDDAHAYAALGTATAIMATQFAFANAVSGWLTDQGLPAASARDYVSGLLRGLCATIDADPERDFARLSDAHATPGSFNDFLRERLEANGTFAAVASGLGALLPRMMGERT